MPNLTARQSSALPVVRAWLFVIAFLIFCMVIVGGATRLTDSGLSITEWQPLLGAIPPLSEADWLAAFEKYKLIPEYRTVNSGMSLAEFRFIYWWEWAHRFLGRIIGVVFFVPLAFFSLTRRLSRRTALQCLVIFVLGGLQGALGWYMVASGLIERVDVSQYRLSAHLTLATIVFAAALWVAIGLGHRRRPVVVFHDWMTLLLVGLTVLQIAAGGFVAGLDAGMGYNTWPLMDGALIPDGLFIMDPAWANLFENAMTVQFNHRLLAYGVLIFAAAHAAWAPSGGAMMVLMAVLLQVALGIWTLVWQVPLWLGLLHQGGALVVLAAALWSLHLRLTRSPVPDRR